MAESWLARSDRTALSTAATARAREHLVPGDRVSRTLCCGRRGTFTFTHWDGSWICGKTVYDCGAINILSVNGRPVDFAQDRPFEKLKNPRVR